jgi:hypothetical protein
MAEIATADDGHAGEKTLINHFSGVGFYRPRGLRPVGLRELGVVLAPVDCWGVYFSFGLFDFRS